MIIIVAMKCDPSAKNFKHYYTQLYQNKLFSTLRLNCASNFNSREALCYLSSDRNIPHKYTNFLQKAQVQHWQDFIYLRKKIELKGMPFIYDIEVSPFQDNLNVSFPDYMSHTYVHINKLHLFCRHTFTFSKFQN